ncbi:MAG: alpha/beta hydrolase domain-containing protein [Rhodospirillaceae bacterium]
MNRPRQLSCLIGSFLSICVSLGISSAYAAVERIEILDRMLVSDGQNYGRVGPYVRIAGRLHYAIDPQSDFNASIHDLEFAPTDARGLVTYSGDFVLLMPLDPERGNGRLLYDVTNRGNMVALNRFNNATGRTAARSAADLGNGFLMEQGYAVLWTAWNWDVVRRPNTLTIDLPVATQPDGTVITGQVISEMAPTESSKSLKHIGLGALGYTPTVWNPQAAQLSVRGPQSGTYETIPRQRWQFGLPLEEDSASPLLRDPNWVTLDTGFVPGKVYRLAYGSQNPPIVGLGLSALRDAVSFFSYETGDSYGNANPLTSQGGGLPQATVAYGHSQSGRLLNTLLWEGLHVDEQGRSVFDGLLIDGAGAGKGSFNFRFAQTSRHFSPDQDLDFPTDFFPFSTVEQVDTVTNEQSSLLDEARRLNAVPRIFIINTASEYWARSASLVHTDTLGSTDITPDPSVRLYMIAGGQHAIGTSDKRGALVHCRSPLDHRPVLRALLSHIDAWITVDRAPPPSQYPKIADGSLVTTDQYRTGFPDAAFMRTPKYQLLPPRLDHGPRFASEGIADNVPPLHGKPYETRVPASNEDGLDIAGIRLPDIEVPLGAHTGWNPQTADTGAPNRLARWSGSFIPFSRTVTERNATGDPRPAITERYTSRTDYTNAYAEATLELANQELILGMDINPMIEKAGYFYDQVMSHNPADESCRFANLVD